VRVGEQLDLDVSGALEVALEEDGVVAEGGLGFTLGRGNSFFELARLASGKLATTLSRAPSRLTWVPGE
jgi:hypothetical protein